ncbi:MULTISPECIES: squalene/phytoene synthase family protein [Streptomyces]|uniref:Squalene/phytoene synthase family protein n=1 Tax=Streptomyces griseiscabiei TaxID=2993540 RepID=A0ABU4L339_9ACTN|nr:MULTISPECIES: squalene/phytoene synthase family protein [Streptomyces]MBZ3901282.1 squalene/phytoene synthase family protein [Streptomyces griseiscabiei]MDX2910167.1 squalene/phytoene synthase family protein [Streptomyces griseiscabiei]
MSVWEQSLDAAGVREPESRRDYTAQRDLVARVRRTPYIAARLLAPRPLLPHVVAATAVMHHGDDLLDTGPKPQRISAWASWEEAVRKALDTGISDDPLIRALVHTTDAHPRLRVAVEEYLATATTDLEFTGFATEADYQAYVDAYSLPAFLLVACLVGPETDDARYGRFRAACRTLIDGSQRLDFVNDLAEDLPEGRLGIPLETLDRFSVSVADLAEGRESAAVRELVEDQVEAARVCLRAAAEEPVLTAGPTGVLLDAVIRIELLTADAAFARGARLPRGSASPSLPGTLRVLLGARRRARAERR